MLIWGFNKKYQPEWKVEDIQAEMARLASSGSSTVMDEGLSVNLKDRTVTEFFQKKVLLRDIHMNIPQDHMVLPLGGSGAGKTTYLNAINGYEKAHAEVKLNGTDMYKHYKKMQYEIGFVPQSEMMRGKDTVLNTLLDAAKLRLPRNVSARQRRERVDEVMDIFGLKPVKNNLVEKLSGGQKKRLSISMEFISNPGLKVIATQADTNSRPYATISNMVSKMRDSEVGGTVTVGQVMDLLTDTDNETIAELRARELGKVFTLGEIRDALEKTAAFDAFKQERVLDNVTVGSVIKIVLESENLQDIRDYDFGLPGVTLGKLLKDISTSPKAKTLMDTQIAQLTTVGDVLDAIDKSGILDQYTDVPIDARFTIGEAVDLLANSPDMQARRDQEITVKTTVGKLLDIVGEDKVKTFLEDKAAEASYTKDYEYTADNILDYWGRLFLFVLVFAALAMITLEFIDKDKR